MFWAVWLVMGFDGVSAWRVWRGGIVDVGFFCFFMGKGLELFGVLG